MQRVLSKLLVLLVLATGAAAKELWLEKPVKDWNKQETQRFLTDSPWVRTVVVQPLSAGGWDGRPGPGVPLGENTTVPGPSGGGSSPGSASGMPSVGAGSAGPGTRYFVNWASSKIWRYAKRHEHALMGGKEIEDTDPPAAPEYVLVVYGPDMRAFEGITEEQLKTGVNLRLKKSKLEVAPSRALVGTGPDGRLAYLELHFPREANGQSVLGDEKQVEFVLKAKGENLKATFKLDKMVTEKGPDL